MSAAYTIVVPDTEMLSLVCGTNDCNLRLIEEHLGVPLLTRGNELSLMAENSEVQERFRSIIDRLVGEAVNGAVPDEELVAYVLNIEDKDPCEENGPHLRSGSAGHSKGRVKDCCISIPGGMKRVYPKTANQVALIKALYESDLVFAVGPAGTGKTYLAVAAALELVLSRKKEGLVLTRPVVEAGESLGFLPGDLEQKINPYLRPLYDAIGSLIGRDPLRKLLDSGTIEIAPLAYMRGRTLQNCVVLLDEAQNTTREQMKMFLTRHGDGSKVIVTGDVTQIDLPRRSASGLIHALAVLENTWNGQPGTSRDRGAAISMVEMDFSDCIRSPLVKKIVRAYEESKA